MSIHRQPMSIHGHFLTGAIRACFAAAALASAAVAAAPYMPAASQTFLPAPAAVPGQSSYAGQAPAAATAAPADPASTPPASEQWVDQQTAKYRSETEARVARGDLNPDEAERLIGWRHWQLQQQAAGEAPAPQIMARQNAADRARANVVVVPGPGGYYPSYPTPYYAPYYGGWYRPGYGPFVPGVSVCTGGIGRHYAASVCF